MFFLRRPEHLHVEMVGLSYGMTEHPWIEHLPPHEQAEIAKAANGHPGNQDAFYINPDVGLIVADGVGSQPKSGEGSRAAVAAFAGYLDVHQARNERPDTVAAMLTYAAEAATQAMFEACGIDIDNDMGPIAGSTTFTGFFRTADPRQWLLYHVGDSRGLHVRPGKKPEGTQILHRTIDQVIPVDANAFPNENGSQDALSNAFGGYHHLRPTAKMLPEEFADRAHLYVDQITPIEVKSGDWLIAHSDGLATTGPNTRSRMVDPLIVARAALQHQTPQQAVVALAALPEKRAAEQNRAFNDGHSERARPKLDDLTVAIGEITIRR